MGSQRFVTGSRDQAFLLPPDMRDWLSEEHLVWVVVDAVERLDLDAMDSAYRDDGNGRPPYDPRVMVALLLYAYASGERSSRAIERRCREDIAFRVSSAGLDPDHATVARFRRRHSDALLSLFSQVLELCRAAGLGRVGTIAIDGTKVAANACKERYALHDQAARILAEAEAIDCAEDELPGDARAVLLGDGGAGGHAERRARLDRAAALLSSCDEPAKDSGTSLSQTNKARGRELAAARRGKPNLTDPDSRVMRARRGWIQGYNAQVAVADDHVIVACEITSKVNDHAQLEPMIAATRAALPADTPIEFLADSGYWSGPAIERLTEHGEQFLVPPNGRPRSRGVGGNPTVTNMIERLEDPETRGRYRRRQALVEPVIAHLKCHRRLDRFLLRGTAGARLEWSLGCTAHNLARLARAS